MTLSRWTRVQASATVAVAIAAVAVAIINPGSSGAAATTRSTNTLGTSICFGFGQARLSEYDETASSLPQVVAEAKQLTSAARWKTVGDALTTMTTFGPTKGWTAAERKTARRSFHVLHDACRPHLR